MVDKGRKGKRRERLNYIGMEENGVVVKEREKQERGRSLWEVKVKESSLKRRRGSKSGGS